MTDIKSPVLTRKPVLTLSKLKKCTRTIGRLRLIGSKAVAGGVRQTALQGVKKHSNDPARDIKPTELRVVTR